MKSNFSSRLKFGVSAIAVIAMSITAQTAYAADKDKDSLEEIVVMGSRIVRKDLTSASPVTVMNAEDVTVTGTTRIEDLVTSLPQAFVAQNSTVSNGASGTATVNLRKLGANRTLVLVNGRRLMPGDPKTSATDLNFIPSALVKRVSVLTGGASSVYGTDAVAGVVNFELDTNFEGIKVGAQYSFYQHNNRNKFMRKINKDAKFNVPEGSITDGHTYNINLAVGGSFADDRGHASAYITYRNIENIPKANRDYSNCTLRATDAGTKCGGSSNTPWGTFKFKDALTLDTKGRPKTVSYVVDDSGNFTKRLDNHIFNYGPYNFFQRDDVKISMGAFANYKINDSIEVYTELMFMDDQTTAQIAPSGNYNKTKSINCDNPMLTATQLKRICTDQGFSGTDTAPMTINRRNIEGGPRRSDKGHVNFRILAGARGDITDTWSYDLYGMFAKSSFSEIYSNDLNVNRIIRSVDVIMHKGKPTCRSVVDGTDPNCVPWNIFQKGAVTDEAVKYISTVANAQGYTKTTMMSGSITGSLEEYGIQIPSSDEAISVAFGVEYRKEESSYNPDEVFAMGLRAGGGGGSPAIKGEFDVKEIFGEMLIPIVQDSAFAQDLSLELAYRYSDYSTAGGNSTFKIAANWQPIEDVKLRAGFNRAVRAPNIVELFSPQSKGLGGSVDICAGDFDANGTTVNGYTEAQCARTGMTSAQFGATAHNPAKQYNTYSGGNPKLKSETADTFTAGMVITPEALPGFSMTIDWYSIKISDAIDRLKFNDIVKGCAETGEAVLCGYIHRYDGTLWEDDRGVVDTLRVNVAELQQSGIDISTNYSTDVDGLGGLSFSMNGTYLLNHKFKDLLIGYDCVGYYGDTCGSPVAKWRHRARLSLDTNIDLKISLSWRFTGGADIDINSTQKELNGTDEDRKKATINGINGISSANFFDLSLAYPVTDEVKVVLGVNNIFDKEPPIMPGLTSTGFGNSYDGLGRYIFMSMKMSF